MALSASQRIGLIKEVATRLVDEEWSLIDLTLKQFQLPWTDQWSGNKFDYLLKMLAGADDQSLIDLAQHCGHTFAMAPHPTGIDPPFWKKGMLRAFVSHLGVKRVEVATLQKAFLSFGVSCFVAHSDIEPTEEWQAQIETALATCEVLVAVLHPGFHESDWTDQEIGFAMGRGLPIYAVQFGEAPYGFIGRFQAFTGTNKEPHVLAQEIFKKLIQHKQTQARMADVVVTLFEESDNYYQANDRAEYLRLLEVWQPSYSSRILAAVETNSQISGAWHAPGIVKAIVKKWTPDLQGELDEEIPF